MILDSLLQKPGKLEPEFKTELGKSAWRNINSISHMLTMSEYMLLKEFVEEEDTMLHYEEVSTSFGLKLLSIITENKLKWLLKNWIYLK